MTLTVYILTKPDAKFDTLTTKIYFDFIYKGVQDVFELYYSYLRQSFHLWWAIHDST